MTGSFGALDQIVPHELSHVLRRQLVGELAQGGTNQGHALGVRTDRVVAFNEGFAEPLQAVAFTEAPVGSILRDLAEDQERAAAVQRHLQQYRRELTARLALAPPMRIGFVAWYSNDEDVLRYRAVRDNAFAREPDIPERLLQGPDPYSAYLLESVLPGTDTGAHKSLSRMLATEGVVAALFYRWATDETLRGNRRAAEFYAPFGVEPGSVTDLENVYLKLVDVYYRDRPQSVLDVVNAYRHRFPDEAAAVERVAAQVFGDHALDAPPEIWLANRSFVTGTTLFDQYRGLPRTHTFDLNAASVTDLVSVPGIDRNLAMAIQAAAPFEQIADLGAVDGLSPALLDRLRAMAAEMPVLRAELEAEAEQDLSIFALFVPLIRRLIGIVAATAAAAALLYRQVRRGALRPGWRRCALNGTVAAVVGLIGGWLLGGHGLGAVTAVAILCGAPAGAWQRWRGEPRAALRVLAAWAIAALAAAFVTTPWF